MKYDIKLPGEFSTLQRAILLIEGVCLELDPRYKIQTIAIPVSMDAYKKLSTPKGAGIHIELSTEPRDEKAEIRAAVRELAERMGEMGDRLMEGQEKEKKAGSFSKEFYVAVLLILSTYILLRGDAFAWIGAAGFAGALLIWLLAVLRAD